MYRILFYYKQGIWITNPLSHSVLKGVASRHWQKPEAPTALTNDLGDPQCSQGTVHMPHRFEKRAQTSSGSVSLRLPVVPLRQIP